MGRLTDLLPFRDRTAPSSSASALERAAQAHGGASNGVTRVVESLLDVGIDGRGPFLSAQAVADRARARNPDREAAVDAVVRHHIALAGVEGFATSLGGFVVLPVAMPTNVFLFYVLATRMTGSIAALRGHDLAQPQIRTAALLTLAGADADDLLAKAGVTRVGPLTNLAAQRLPGPALMVVNKALGFRLLTMTGRTTLARLGKSIPLVGGAIGAGVDAYLLDRLADHARREFPVATPPTS